MFGSIEVIVFPDTYNKFSYMLKEEAVIVVSGRATIAEDQPSKVICEEIKTFEQLDDVIKTLWLKIPIDKNIEIGEITKITSEHKGNSKVIIYVEKTKQRFNANSDNYVTISDSLIVKFKSLLGENNVVVK